VGGVGGGRGEAAEPSEWMHVIGGAAGARAGAAATTQAAPAEPESKAGSGSKGLPVLVLLASTGTVSGNAGASRTVEVLVPGRFWSHQLVEPEPQKLVFGLRFG
jgi:hypothetical protein